MWQQHERNEREALRDAYSRFLLMRNLDELVAGADLYVMKKRGLFKTTCVRTARPRPGERPTVVERTFSRTDVEEIEYRYAALAPYLS